MVLEEYAALTVPSTRMAHVSGTGPGPPGPCAAESV